MSDVAKALDFLTVQQTVLLQNGAFSLEATSTVDPNSKPPWIEFGEGALAFDEQGTVDIPLVGVTTTALTFTVPDGYDGIIKRLSCNDLGGGFVSGSGDLLWRITADSRPIKNYSNILTELGTLQIPRITDGIRIFSNQVISFVLVHVANVMLAGKTTCTLAGWYYPRGGE